MKMMKKILAVKARQNLGQVMNEVALRGNDYVVERLASPRWPSFPWENTGSFNWIWTNFGKK